MWQNGDPVAATLLPQLTYSVQNNAAILTALRRLVRCNEHFISVRLLVNIKNTEPKLEVLT